MRKLASGVASRHLQAPNRSTPAPKRPCASATVRQGVAATRCSSISMRTKRRQVALAVRFPIAEVEACAEIAALALEHDGARLLGLRLIHRRDQRLDQPGRQRVHLVGRASVSRCSAPRRSTRRPSVSVMSLMPVCAARSAPSTSLCSPSGRTATQRRGLAVEAHRQAEGARAHAVGSSSGCTSPCARPADRPALRIGVDRRAGHARPRKRASQDGLVAGEDGFQDSAQRVLVAGAQAVGETGVAQQVTRG